MKYETDNEGYLVDRSLWTEDVAKELASNDGYELNTEQMELINKARDIYEDTGTVPPIRKFSKAVGMNSRELYQRFPTGPMKMICKWGGLPKPTGCV